MLMPFYIGFGVLIMVKMPNNMSYETFVLAFSAFLFGAVFFHVNAKPHPFAGHKIKRALLIGN